MKSRGSIPVKPSARARSWRATVVLLGAAMAATMAAEPPRVPAAAAAVAGERLGPGVVFIRDVRRQPRPLVIAVVEIDMRQKGLEFFVTPGDPTGGRELRAMTTGAFLTKHRLQVAVNGGFFAPFQSGGPGGFRPRPGDGVDVFGLCASGGHVYSQDEADYSSLNISRDGGMAVIDEAKLAWQAVSGRRLELAPSKRPADPAIHPRTALALDHRGKRMIWMVVDGRQPGYSEGVTLAELAGLLAERGGEEALNLDGGGSSTMVCADAKGPRLLNRPVHLGIAGTERPVANHLGLRWKNHGAGPDAPHDAKYP